MCQFLPFVPRALFAVPMAVLLLKVARRFRALTFH
jgi:hypothetical protein